MLPAPSRRPAASRLRLPSLLALCAALLAFAGCSGGPDVAVSGVAEVVNPPPGAAAAVAAKPPREAFPPARIEATGHLRPEPWAEAPARAGGEPPEVSAASAIVLDEASMAVLYEKDAHTRRGPASLTKIVTAILAVEYGDLGERVVTDVDAREMRRSTVMGLRPGDAFTLHDLLYGLMLPSGNDAALAIARHLAGSEERFAAQMTAFARRLGLEDSNFVNPHGLGRRGHYSSAYDLAVLARYLMAIPELREVVAAREWTAEGSRTIEMRTYNALLGRVDGVDGVKTGYTRTSGRTFVASATRGDHRIYVVLLNAPDRETDARRLIDWAFASHHWPDAVVDAPTPDDEVEAARAE